MLNNLIETKDHFHLERWSKIDFLRVRRDLQFPATFKEDIPLLKEKLNNILAEKDKDNSVSESRMVQDLINVLDGYKSLSLKIPGINKTVIEFIEDLKKIKEEKESVMTISKNIKLCLELLKNINDEVEDIENNYFSSLRQVKKRQSKRATSSREFRLLRDEIIQLKENLERLFRKRKHFEELFLEVGEPTKNEIQEIGKGELSDYQGYNEEQLETEINRLCDKLEKEKKKIESCEYEIKKKKHELEIHQSRKEHKYQHKLSELQDLKEKTAFLLAKLKNDFNRYIMQIIDNNINECISDEQKKYNEAIFRYLAKRLRKIRHITGLYQVKKVDLVKQEIITEEGKIIPFDDMGTGQSQSAYLTGLLHANDGRKIIALFDEVAMMTEESLELIYQRLRELYQNKTLLLGIVVQKAKKVKVISKLN
jgi:exonuclease SbcC